MYESTRILIIPSALLSAREREMLDQLLASRSDGSFGDMGVMWFAFILRSAGRTNYDMLERSNGSRMRKQF